MFAALAAPGVLSGQCGDNEPARPVPECRDELTGTEVSCGVSGAVRLWPGRLRPGLPGEQLPAWRDSTQWRSFTVPGFESGHELFQSLDSVDGEHLYVAYNAGLQVWTLDGVFVDDPQRLAFADGWLGHFLSFPVPGENDFFVFDVDAVPRPGGPGALIALAGADGVGFSVWEHSTLPTGLSVLYQDLGTPTERVRAIELDGGAWAWGADGFFGVFAYDLSAAFDLVSPCLDDAGSVCPGVYRGRIGDGVTVSSNAHSIDVIERDGALYLAVARDVGLATRIWALGDPGQPGSSSLRFEGLLSSGSRSPALFEQGGHYYLGIVERVSINPEAWRPRIYSVDACLDADGCSSLGQALWSGPVAEVGEEHFLTYSRGLDRGFLYFGVHSNGLDGSRVEGLWDLTGLGSANSLSEVTEAGESYFDGCSTSPVDYWGDYYSGNEHGLRNARPRVGRVVGNRFYRAAFGFLDVHVLRSELFADGFESGDLDAWSDIVP